MKTTTWWFAVTDEDSDLCGEEFFVEIESLLDEAKAKAMAYAKEIFPNVELKCYGRVSSYEAECMGLDTY